MRRDLDWFAIGERLQASIEAGWFSHLDMKGACQEERTQSQAYAEPFAPAHEVEACG